MNFRFWGIFWIDARNEGSITKGFANIARRCGQHDESLEGAMSWLQNTHHSWLLILDNADNPDLDLHQFSPAGRKGSILITTRLTECAEYHTTGDPDYYEKLSRDTATTLLLKASRLELTVRGVHEDNAHAVVDLLGYHALAIIQAGAAISQGLCNLREYREMFLSQRRILLSCFPKQASSEYRGVYATFEVSATHLASLVDPIGKDALELLNFYASINFTDFPEIAFEEAWMNSRDETVVSSDLNADGEEDIEMLSPWHVSNLPIFMKNNSDDMKLHRLRFRKARSLLVSLSLVTFDSDRNTTHMHPVSHFWSRDRLQNQEISKAGISGLCVVSLSMMNPYTRDFDQLRSQLQPHIESIAYRLKEMDFQESKFYFQQSVYRLWWALCRLSCDSALFDLLQMIPVLADSSWIRTENGQNIQNLHGICMSNFGDASKAIILLEQLNEARAQTLAAEDPRYIASQHSLAKAYLKNGDTIRAIEIFERVVCVRDKILGPEHINTQSSQHELAGAYLQVEENEKAIVLLETVVEIRIRTLGPEHPECLKSQHELARAYLCVEDNEKAIALLETVVEIRTRTLRPEHRDFLASRYNLAKAYLSVEENGKAIALLETAVEIKTRTLRPEHPERLKSQHELARAYLQIKETAKAIALLEKVVEIRTRRLRADHPARVVSIHTLAYCHYRSRNYERALQLARSIEDVAQNRRGDPVADRNVELIGYILEEMEEMEETRLRDLRLEEVD